MNSSGVADLPSDHVSTRVPSWNLVPEDHDLTEDEVRLLDSRSAENLKAFLATPQTEYSVDQVAEILTVPPARVPGIVADLFGQEWRNAFSQEWRDRTSYPRSVVFDIALERCSWDLSIFERAFAMMKPDQEGDAPASKAPHQAGPLIEHIKITEHLADGFVTDFFRRSRDAGAIDEALALSSVIPWPDDVDASETTPDQLAWLATEERVLAMIEAIVREPLKAAFRTAMSLELNASEAVRHA